MRILLVDSDERQRRSVSRLLESEMDDWKVASMQCGADALSHLASFPCDVIVTEMQLPDMNGAELLHRVEQERREIFRIVLSGKADRESVLRAVQPMHQYLAKPCDLNTLIQIIQRAEAYHHAIASTSVLDAIGKANGLFLIPEIVNDVTQALNDEDWTANKLAVIVQQDPLLCARVLQVANSAIYALPRPVHEVAAAISIVGGLVLRSLVMSHAFRQRPNSGDSQWAKSVFDHSFSVASCARRIASYCAEDRVDGPGVFSGAILHDVGKIILMEAFPDEYPDLIQDANISQRPLWQCELESLGVSHQGVGAYLLELWGVPGALIEMVASHHCFGACSRRNRECQIVYAANWINRGADEMLIQAAKNDCRDIYSAEKFANDLLKWKTMETEPCLRT